jgi:transposase InsO family protein
MKTPVYDLIIGNVDGARNAEDPDPKWRPETCAVTTRSQEKKSHETIPLKVADNTEAAVVNKDKMVELQRADSTLDKFRGQTDPVTRRGKEITFEIKNDILYRVFTSHGDKPVRQVVVPELLRIQVMKLAHDSILGGHLGISKTLDRIRAVFYWPDMGGDITRFCRSCDICQKTIPKGRVPKVPLEKMPLIDMPFKRVAVDLVGPISPPSEDGHRYILTLVDYATRYPEAIPLKKIDTPTVAEALVDMFSRLGIPEEILSDLGTQFVSDCMEEVNRLLSIRHLTTTPYHPMCNGLVEKFNGTLKAMLKKLCAEQPRSWHRYINALLFAYREVPQDSTGFSPFELLYGRTVRGPMHILKELWTKDIDAPEVKISYQYVFDLREKLEDTLRMAREALEKAQSKGKHYYDRKAKPRRFQPDDKVLILLPTDNNKLLMQWKGPYVVDTVVGINDYRVKVNKKTKTYHANLLKKYVERSRHEEPQEAASVCLAADERLDDANLFDLNELRHKEGVEDIQFGQNLTQAQQEQLRVLTSEFKHRFTPDPGTTDTIHHEVNLTSKEPVYSKPYRLPYNTREDLKKDIKEMLDLRVIRESRSPYASPVVIVKKPDGSNRVCVDYRKLNKLTVFDPEPMPTAEELFQKVSGDRVFSKVDLSKGYWQIKVAEKDIYKTAFVTPDGHWEFLKMPFGMVNSGATLKRGLKKILEDMQNVIFYWDDILIHTKTWEDHIKALRELFQRLSVSNFTIRPSKCILGADNVDFIGHRLSEGLKGLHEDNVKKIKDAPRPTTKTQVRSFMGLANYYREYVPNFAAVTAPLTDLLKKGQPNKVNWEEAQERAFQAVRDILVEKPVLHLPDPSKTFILRTDASNDGVGAILMQEDDGKLHPVSYASKKLNQAEKNYSTIEKECLAIIWGVRKFELYLQGVPFVLQTDHQPLSYLNSAKFTNARIMRWAMFLQNFDVKLQSIKGSQNFGADYLSRAV